tara:strand:+ start:1855 stop:3321 length:1467 start_codon:yes stop_codon:yes gene_type:complete
MPKDKKTQSSYYDPDTYEQLDINPDRVVIFTIKGSKKGIYYVRILRKQGSGYFQCSLKTSSRTKAIEEATTKYMQMWGAEDKKIVFSDARFQASFHEFLVKRTFSKNRESRIKSVYRRYFSKFFKNIPLSNIDDRLWMDYLRWRCEYWTKEENLAAIDPSLPKGTRVYHYAVEPSRSTLKAERQILKQFLYWCMANHKIDRAPRLTWSFKDVGGLQFKNYRQKAQSISDDLDDEIIDRLHTWCITNNAEEKTAIRQFGRYRLYAFINICRNALIRPSTEATSILWEDVTFVQSKRFKGHQLAIIEIKNPKVGKQRAAVLPYEAVDYLLHWAERSKEFGYGHPSQHLFPKWVSKHDREQARSMGAPYYPTVPFVSSQAGRLLGRRLKEWGCNKDAEGRTVTLYSIARHKPITDRIIKSGWDVGRVATGAGTSVLAISQFYFKEFMKADPDRWAVTFKDGVPRLKDRKRNFIQEGIDAYEDALELYKETE